MSTVAHVRPCTLSRVSVLRENGTNQKVRSTLTRASPLSHTRRYASLRIVAKAHGAKRVTTNGTDIDGGSVNRRDCILSGIATTLVGGAFVSAPPAFADDFVKTASGLKYFDAKKGEGLNPEQGDTVVVHWSMYTSGYQGKRVENTSVRDEPFVFTIGKNEVIPGFEEAVLGMNVGGLRRVEILGEYPELSYPRDRKERFTDLVSENQSVIGIKYRYGPQPSELGGQRALDFVLDNPTLQPFNRNLVVDIRLLNIRGRKN